MAQAARVVKLRRSVRRFPYARCARRYPQQNRERVVEYGILFFAPFRRKRAVFRNEKRFLRRFARFTDFLFVRKRFAKFFGDIWWNLWWSLWWSLWWNLPFPITFPVSVYQLYYTVVYIV